jgi:hypothetical protein
MSISLRFYRFSTRNIEDDQNAPLNLSERCKISDWYKMPKFRNNKLLGLHGANALFIEQGEPPNAVDEAVARLYSTWRQEGKWGHLHCWAHEVLGVASRSARPCFWRVE